MPFQETYWINIFIFFLLSFEEVQMNPDVSALLIFVINQVKLEMKCCECADNVVSENKT